jgi:carbamoyltransferase
LSKHPSLNLIKDRLKNATKVKDIKSKLCEEFNIDRSKLKAQVHNIEHHVAHSGSTFLVSPFEEAAIVSVDGFGDFVGAMWGIGRSEKVEIKDCE